MAFGLVPVDVAPAVRGVDRHVRGPARLAAIGDLCRLDPGEYSVELPIADMEAEVMRRDRLGLTEIERQRIVHVNRRERAGLVFRPGHTRRSASIFADAPLLRARTIT